MNPIKNLINITKNILDGNEEAQDELNSFMRSYQKEDTDLVNLAENISMLNVHKDVQTFRLEQIIEDLLTAQKELDVAKHDPLTGLPNRTLFYDILNEKCEENTGSNQVALMFIDLDKFKQINDTLGHDAGDEILQLATKRMHGCIKSSDVLCRLGGDEFTVIFPQVEDKAIIEEIATRIIEELSKPFQLKNGEGNIGGSIGISFYPDDAASSEALVKNSDVAMYKAKEGGRNKYELYRSNPTPYYTKEKISEILKKYH